MMDGAYYQNEKFFFILKSFSGYCILQFFGKG